MSKALPYFRWYPADAEVDEKYIMMTNEELGFFHRCLNKSWRNGGIPADPCARARLFSQPQRIIDKLWEVVGKCFVESTADPSRLVNPRQEKEREYAQTKSARASKAIRTRYDSNTDVDTDVYTDVDDIELPPASDSDSYSSICISKKGAGKKQTDTSELDAWFANEFWPAFWLKKSKTDALKAARVHLGSAELRFAALFGMKAQTPEMLTRDPSKRPHGATWINGHRWEDEVISSSLFGVQANIPQKPWSEYSPEERAQLPGHMNPGLIGPDNW